MKEHLGEILFGPREIKDAGTTTLKTEETEGRFRGYLGRATGDTSEHLKGLAEEAKGLIQKDFGKTARSCK